MKKTTEYLVECKDAVRIDRYVRGILAGVTQSLIEKLIRKRLILLNGEKTKSAARVSAGDVVSICNADAIEIKKKEIQVKQCEELTKVIQDSITYQNEHIIAINKPSGVNVQGGTCVGISICDLLDKIVPGEELFIVHRLDKATTGVLVLARGITTARRLSEEFRHRRVKKEYIAVTRGVPASSSGVIDLPILRKKNCLENRCSPSLQQAQTHYSVLKSNGTNALFALSPITGRKHQLRIHLSQIGCPIIGDTKYDKEHLSVDPVPLHLHAWKITFTIYDNSITIEAPVHAHMMKTLKELFEISEMDDLVTKT